MHPKYILQINKTLQKVELPSNYKHLFSFVGKYLIVSKEGHEIVDFVNPKAKYELLANKVPRAFRATGDNFQNLPIVCGGETNQDSFVVGQPEMEIKMFEKRYWAATVKLDQCTLWIVGGRNGINNLSSTEFILFGQYSFKGPNLPFTICGHSMIQYDEKSIYIIGGELGREINDPHICNKTWIVDPTNGWQIKEGPSLNMERAAHSCAKMTVNGKTVLVVIGGFRNDFNFLDSVEILDPSGKNIWTQGMYLKSVIIELCLLNFIFYFRTKSAFEINKTNNGDITNRKRSYCHRRKNSWICRGF